MPHPHSIQAHASDLPDPQIDRRRRHKLLDILMIARCAGLCGIDDWAGVALFAKLEAGWFRTFRELPGGILSHHTFGRVFSRLDSKAFEVCFRSWIAALAQAATEGVMAIDGKSLRGLDVTYRDDANPIRKDHGPQSMTVLRRLSVNLLRQIELGPQKVSLRGRLIMANHGSAFVLKALGF